MADLNDTMREEIVRRLARFETPTNVAKAVSEEFFEDPRAISKQQVHAYNPGAAGFQGSQKWVYVFDAERAAYLASLASHEASSVGYRVGMLQKIAERAYSQGNMPQAMDALERIAKEVGGAYTNRQESRHTLTIDDRRKPASIEEARRELNMRLETMRKALPSAPAVPASEQVIDQ